jgi:hypothetical protein
MRQFVGIGVLVAVPFLFQLALALIVAYEGAERVSDDPVHEQAAPGWIWRGMLLPARWNVAFVNRVGAGLVNGLRSPGHVRKIHRLEEHRRAVERLERELFDAP